MNVVAHNLIDSNTPLDGDYVAFENVQGMIGLNGLILPVYTVVDADHIQFIVPVTVSGAYTGGGTLARVSNIQIASKQWNPHDKDGGNIYLAKIDFAATRTSTGALLVDYLLFSITTFYGTHGTATNTIMGTNVLETYPYDTLLYPLEQYQDKLWHSVYFQTSGNCVQIAMYMTDAQLRNSTIAWSNFELQGMILYTELCTRIQ